MMTTPRVTEIPLAMARVEPDSFIDDGARPAHLSRPARREARTGYHAAHDRADAAQPAHAAQRSR